MRDFAPVTRIGITPNMITVHPSVPFRSVKALIAYAKPTRASSTTRPGCLIAATLDGVAEARGEGRHREHPLQSGAQAVTDTIAGQIPMNISNAPVTVGPIQSGRLRPLAVTSAMRAPHPDYRTVEEAGLADFDVQSWQGVCAPAGMSAALLGKIHEDFNAVLRAPDVQARMSELMMPPAPTARGVRQVHARQIARWAKVIRDAAIPQQ